MGETIECSKGKRQITKQCFTTQKTKILATRKNRTKNLPTQVQHYNKHILNAGKNKTNVAMTCNWERMESCELHIVVSTQNDHTRSQ